MKNKTLWIIAIIFVVVLVGGMLLYQNLSGKLDDTSSRSSSATSSASSNADKSKALDFTVESLDGTKVNLFDFKDQIVVINFWTTWCGYCQEEMPAFEKVANEYREKDVVFLFVNPDEDKETISSYLQKNNLNIDAYMDIDYQASKIYGASSLPTTFIIDQQQNVAYAQKGLMQESTLRGELDKLVS